MSEPNLIILYVNDPLRSAKLYADLLEKTPLELHPTFALFALDTGVMLGLWSRHTAQPSAICTGGGGEIAFIVADQTAVEALYHDWTGRGLVVAQKPVAMDFGYTFVVLDPDQHRLRVFAPLPKLPV
jgi:hypothetical protein